MAAKKKKGKRGRNRVDEYKLRRELREQSHTMDLDDLDEETVVVPEEVDLSQYAEQIRIGGIEG